MLNNIFLEIEYDGTGFFGWQVQGHKDKKSKGRKESVRTVQGELEKALLRLFNRDIGVHSSGRTDRGVHANAQCVNFKVQTRIPLINIKTALNTFLPDDIYIRRIKKVSLDFHARFSACSKIYRYIISTHKQRSVFNRNYAWHMTESLDLTKIQKAISWIVGKKDFSCFAKEAAKYKSCTRAVKALSVKKRGPFLYFDIEASGFLRNMVRNIITFLIYAGSSKIPLKNMRMIIKGKFPYTNKPAPARGLYLLKVKYGASI